jgi:hypothetical protein
MAEIDKVHEQLMEEEGLKLTDLPSALQKKVKGWNVIAKRLEKNPDDVKLARQVQKISIEIADKIQDFIETDYEEDDGNEPNEPKEPKEPSEPKEPQEPSEPKEPKEPSEPKEPKEPSEPKEPKAPAKPKGFGNLVMKKKILQAIKDSGDGRISIGQLQKIIGKEPDYPEQKVHDITLRKVFMSSEYRLL